MEKVELLKNYGVQVNDALEFWGDMISYEENLKEFQESLTEKLQNLEYYKNTNDWENYGILSHSTKSEAKYLGFIKDAEVFLNHEQAGKNNDSAYIENHYQELKDKINQINGLLTEYFKLPNNSKKSLLIADDSNIMLNFIEQVAANEFQVIRANNGKEAITKLNNNEIYALILDLNMPSMNGFEVLEYMKENELLEKIPVIVITGDDSQETIKKAFTYPILDVLNKPFNEENISRVLTSIKSFYEKK